jgi:hypothetical protein
MNMGLVVLLVIEYLLQVGTEVISNSVYMQIAMLRKLWHSFIDIINYFWDYCRKLIDKKLKYQWIKIKKIYKFIN